MTTHETAQPDAPRRVTVTRDREGWEVLEEGGNGVVRRIRYTDWHRVERAAGLHAPAAGGAVPYSTKR